MKSRNFFPILGCMVGLLLVTSCNKEDIQKAESKISLRADYVDDCEVFPLNDSWCFITVLRDPGVQEKIISSNDLHIPRIFWGIEQTKPNTIVIRFNSPPKPYWQTDNECELTSCL